jgi:hypothetical protein
MSGFVLVVGTIVFVGLAYVAYVAISAVVEVVGWFVNPRSFNRLHGDSHPESPEPKPISPPHSQSRPPRSLRKIDKRISKAEDYRYSLRTRISHLPEDAPEREVLQVYFELAQAKCESLKEDRRRVEMDIEDKRARKELGI